MRKARKNRSSRRSAPRADTNGQCNQIITRTTPRLQNGISNFTHLSEPDHLLKRISRGCYRSAASRKHLPQKELPPADDGPIEAEM